jgi:hypothetical protein
MKNGYLIAHSSKNLHVSTDVNIENEEYQQLILTHFVLVLGYQECPDTREGEERFRTS